MKPAYFSLGIVVLGLGCHGETVCPNGKPAPALTSADGTLVTEYLSKKSAPECPKREPRPSAGCTLPQKGDQWPTCFYQSKRDVCQIDSCTCYRHGTGEVVFACGYADPGN